MVHKHSTLRSLCSSEWLFNIVCLALVLQCAVSAWLLWKLETVVLHTMRESSCFQAITLAPREFFTSPQRTGPFLKVRPIYWPECAGAGLKSRDRTF